MPPPAAINQVFLVKIDKNVGDGARITLVHRVTLARPISRTAKPFQLLNDDAAVFVLPFEHALEKFFPAEIVAGGAVIFLGAVFGPRGGSTPRRRPAPQAKEPADPHA